MNQHSANTSMGPAFAGCGDFKRTERRRLLGQVGRGLTGQRRSGAVGRRVRPTAAATSLPGVSFAAGGAPSRDVIVYVFLRGGLDGLTICSPHGDPDYAVHRGNMAVPPPGSLDGSIDLDGFFGLSPRAAALLPAYQAGDLAFIHTVGSTDPTRSHFDAMKYIEGGVPNQGATVITTGWLGRHISTTSAGVPGTVLRSAALDFTYPQTLAGAPFPLSIPSLDGFNFAGYGDTRTARKNLLQAMYDGETPLLRSAATATIATVDVLEGIDFAGYNPSGGAMYPNTDFGNRFRNAAALIKAEVGVEALEIDTGGWDHHDDMGPINGQLANMLEHLSETLAAFRTDLGAVMDNVTVVVQSEFGRRVDVNGSAGTDHGRGGCMMVMGGHVNGGRVVRDWIGLDPMNLDDLALPVNIDYRDILIEILRKRAGNPNAAQLFPNHVYASQNIVS